MASINCAGINPNFKKLVQGIDDWGSKSSVKSYLRDPYEAAFKLVETEFFVPLKHLMYIPKEGLTPGQVESFKARLSELTQSIEKGQLDSDFATWFWQTSKYGKKDPVIGSLLGNMQKTSFRFRANELETKMLSKDFFKELVDESLSSELTSRFGIKMAQREMSKLDDKRVRALAEFQDGVEGSKERWLEVEAEIDELTQKSHLKVFDEFIDIIEKDVKVAIDDKYKNIADKAKADEAAGKKYTPNTRLKKALDAGDRILKLDSADMAKYLSKLENRPHMYRAVVSYTKLMDKLYSTLRKGVDVRIDSIIDRLKVNGDDRSSRDFEEIRTKLRGLYMPAYEQGFYPHYTRDLNAQFMDGLMKDFDNIQTAVNPYDMKGKGTREIINSINLTINKHTQRRATSLKDSGERENTYQYSRDLLGSINNYIFDVNRFNYASYMDNYMIESLTAIERIYKTEGHAKGYAKNITDYVLDMHKAANGHDNINPTTKAVMRTLLGFEFVSKLGTNPRGAAKNWFQRVLDFVVWSPKQIKDSREYLQTESIGGESVGSYVETVLRKNGLLYEEASPQAVETMLQSKASASKIIEYDPETNTHTANVKSKVEKLADVMGVVASKTSWMHRKAENSNRKHTFKIAYGQMHKWLNNPMYKNKLAEAGKSTPDAQESAIRRAAQNYAINMVILNHFDYADYAKSRAITGPVGRFLGQFQHYSFEFLERNMGVLREAKYDVKAGEFNPLGDAQGIRQAAMMGIVYFMPIALASAAFGVNIGNVIQHDTAQRADQIFTYLTGDIDEKKSAFYGKGPVLGTLGGPLLSDLIEVGMMMDLINMDEDGWFTLLTGMEKFDPSINSTDYTKKLRILNTFAGRMAERHIPQLSKGRIGWAVQQELGIYPTATSRKIQKKRKKLQKQLLPPDIAIALKQLEEGKL